MSHQPSHTARDRLGGARKLTLVDAIAQSVGFIGPVFSIAFLVPLLVGLNAAGKGAGTAAPLAVLISAVGVLGLGWIIAQYARRIHAAGSLYDYVTEGLGSRLGVGSGILYYAGILALGAGILVMIGGTIHDTLQAEFNIEPLPQTMWDLVLLVLLGAALYLGVALSTRTQLVLALISLAVVLVFSVYVLAKSGASGHQVSSAFTPGGSPQHLSGVFFGVLYGVLLFTGFETAANLGEETASPARDIPRAVILSVVAVSGFYIIGTLAQVAGYHFDLAAIGKNAGAPLFGLAGPVSGGGFGSDAMRRLIELVVIFDMLAVMLGCAVAASRGLFAIARDRHLPSGLAKVSRRGTPLVAGTVVVALDLVVIIVTQGWNGFVAMPGIPHYAAIFSFMTTFGGFALAAIYLLVSVGALRGLRGHHSPAAVALASLVGVCTTAAAIFGSVYKVPAPTIYAPYAGIAVFALGLGLAMVSRRPEPSPLISEAVVPAGFADIE